MLKHAEKKPKRSDYKNCVGEKFNRTILFCFARKKAKKKCTFRFGDYKSTSDTAQRQNLQCLGGKIK